MKLIVLFALTNLLISSVLERHRLKVATSAHTVLFSFFFFILIFGSDDPLIIRSLQTILPAAVYQPIHEIASAISGMQLLLPTIIFESILVFETVFSALYVAWRTAHCLIEKFRISKKAVPARRNRDLLPERIGNNIKINTPKFCYLYCTMLC